MLWVQLESPRTHNIGFYEDLTKIIFELSSNIIKYAPYFFCYFDSVLSLISVDWPVKIGKISFSLTFSTIFEQNRQKQPCFYQM